MNINNTTARIRSIDAFVLGSLSMPVNTRTPIAAEKNMGAIPIAGRGLSAITPWGRSRAVASRKASIVITRS